MGASHFRIAAIALWAWTLAAPVVSAFPGNNPPIILAGPGADQDSPLQGQLVTLSVVAADPDGDALTYTWDFDSGLRAAGPVTTHRFGALCTFSVTVTVSDGNGGVATAGIDVPVANDPVMDPELAPPRVPQNWTLGPKTVLVMLVDFPNAPAIATVQEASEVMNLAAQYFAENSYGQFTILPTVTPVLHLATTAADYPSDPNDSQVGRDSLKQLHEDGRGAARAAGYDPDAFDLDLLWEPHVTGGNSASNANRGANIESAFQGAIEHEVGHNLGLRHADQWRPITTYPLGPGTDINYGNMFDAMGASPIYAGSHYNAYAKHRLHWLPDSAVHDVATSGLYRIHAYDQAVLDATNKYAVKINKDMRDYWLDFRQALPSNSWLMNGVEVCWSSFCGTGGRPDLIDTTPETFNSGSAPDTSDCPLAIGRTLADVQSGIYMTPIGKGGTSPESMDVVINLGDFAGNQPPVITSISPSQTNVAIGATVSFSANASDADGDTLAYYWDFGNDAFASVNSASTGFSFTSTGEYRVRCTVSDMKGGTASASSVITVGAPGTYRISGQVLLAGQPLADVRVFTSTGEYALSDADGSYTLTRLPAGSYTLSASKYNHAVGPSGFGNPVVVGPTNATGMNFVAVFNNVSAPTISAIDDQLTLEDQATPLATFAVFDAQTPSANLMITSSSSNPTLVRDNGVVIGSQGGNRTLTIRPEANQSGTATMTLRVSDGTNTTVETFDVIVSPVNDPPLAGADAFATVGPLSIAAPGILSNDADVEGDAFTAALVAGPLNGEAALNPDGSMLYTPDPLFVGDDAFAYTANDADVSPAAPVTITVPFARLDFDEDGDVDPQDANLFAAILMDQAAAAQDLIRADLTGDGAANALDIHPFIDAIVGL